MSQITICLIVCLITVIGFLLNKYTLGTTAMLGLALFLITGILDAPTVLGLFSNATAVLIVSMFVISSGFTRTQFVKNIAAFISKVAKGSFTKVMAGYIIAAIILCQLIGSNLIPFSILAPLMTETFTEMGYKPSKYIYALGIACIITCVTLPLGGGAATFAQMNGYLESNGAVQRMTILDPMISRLPLLIIMGIYCIFFAPKFCPDEPVVKTEDMDLDKVAGRAMNVKPLSQFQEVAGYSIFFGTTLCLIFSKHIPFPTWFICMAGALLMVLTRVLSAKEAVNAMPWGVYFLYVGSIGMATALSNTGAGEMVGRILANLAGGTQSSILLYSVFFLVPYVATQFMYNMTTMMILYPIVIQTCMALGANPIGPVIVTQAAAFSAILTPVATGTVPYFMGIGGYDQKAILKMGILPTVICFLVTVIWNSIAFPLF
ncbi:MAG: anion permease [Solobacterium sp.]|nr:anion permease [Solobacterium sp.]